MTDAFEQPAASVELDAVSAGWVEAIRQADAQIARYTEIRARAAEHVQEAMGDAAEATIGGQPAVSWKPSKPGMRLDRGKLEEAYGADVIAGYLVPSKPARPFRLLDTGGE